MPRFNSLKIYLFLFLLVLIVTPFVISYKFVRSFLSASQLTFSRSIAIAEASLANKNQFQKTTHFLVLGLDERDDALEKTLLTDTIIFASLNPATNTLNLIPLPRDLWIEKYKTKINSLYYFGKSQDSKRPALLLKDTLSQITSRTVDFTLALNYQNLPALIDLVGGVEIVLETGFSDTKYPNPDFVKDPQSRSPQFITVEFLSGSNHLDGQRALQFVRSRHSLDDKQGSDTGRNSRQLLLVKALINKLSSIETLKNPQLLGRLFLYWQNSVIKDVDTSDVVAILLNLNPKNDLALNLISLPATLNPTGGILVHPPIRKYGQWVYEPRDPSWKELQEFILKSLK